MIINGLIETGWFYEKHEGKLGYTKGVFENRKPHIYKKGTEIYMVISGRLFIEINDETFLFEKQVVILTDEKHRAYSDDSNLEMIVYKNRDAVENKEVIN